MDTGQGCCGQGEGGMLHLPHCREPRAGRVIRHHEPSGRRGGGNEVVERGEHGRLGGLEHEVVAHVALGVGDAELEVEPP